jgi:hypothetical protein
VAIFFTNYTISIHNASYSFSPSPLQFHNKFWQYTAIIRCSFVKNCFTVWYITFLLSHIVCEECINARGCLNTICWPFTFDEYVQHSSNIFFKLSNTFSCLTKYESFVQWPCYFQHTRVFYSKLWIVQEYFRVCCNV